LTFRFSKLQDLLGRKIFRAILEYSGFDTNVSFVEILSELERRSLVNIEKWIELRDIRNAIAHEYTEDEDNTVDEITEIYNNIDYLIELSQRLQEYFNEIVTKRGGDIDIFIIPSQKVENIRAKRAKLKLFLEERPLKPVDILIHQDFKRKIEQEALKGEMI